MDSITPPTISLDDIPAGVQLDNEDTNEDNTLLTTLQFIEENDYVDLFKDLYHKLESFAELIDMSGDYDAVASPKIRESVISACKDLYYKLESFTDLINMSEELY